MGLIPAIILPFNIEIIIIAIAVTYAIGSLAMQRKLSHPKKQRDLQARLNALSKELNAMVKAKAPQEQIMAKQKELMPLMSASMKTQFKPMLVILPLFFIVYYAFLPWFAGSMGLGSTTNVGMVKTLFFIVVFVLGIVSSVVVLLYDRKKAKQEQAEAAAASGASIAEVEAKA